MWCALFRPTRIPVQTAFFFSTTICVHRARTHICGCCAVPCADRTWAWTLWEASLPVPKGKGEMKLVCKAIDAGYNSQPERPEPIWNIRGVLSNSWHRVNLKVADDE